MITVQEKSPARYSDLHGRTAFVSGGATGIGQDIVIALHFQGVNTAFVDIDEAHGTQLCDALEQETGRRPFFAVCDVAQTDQLRDVITRTDGWANGLDILVNNAANDRRQILETVTPDDWDTAVAVNVKHQFFAAQAAAQLMKVRQRGSIINFGSVAPLIRVPDLDVYSLCKTAVSGMTRTLAQTLGHDQIRVNSIIPGCILTPKQLELWITPEDETRILSDQCLHRRLVGHDVAELVLFLASDASSACTSQNFIVDGGLA